MKKFISLVAMATAVCMLGGCGNAPTKADDTTATQTGIEIDAAEYVELGDYKNLSIEVEKVVVSEEDIDNELQFFVEENAKMVAIKDRDVVKENDMVNIDYSLSIDGKEIDEYCDTEIDVTLGDGEYVLSDDFDMETPLVGAKVGDTVKVDVKFPEEYDDEEYAGKAGVITITINQIEKEVLPKLTDKLVKENTDYKTIKEYRESIREELEEQYSSDATSDKQYKVWNLVVENAKILKDFPEDMIKEEIEVLTEQNEEWAGYFGMEVEDFISEYYDMTMEEYATYTIKENCVQSLLLDAEGITVTDADVDEYIQTMISDYGFADEDEIYESYTREEIEEEIQYNQLMDKLLSYTNVTEKEVTMAESEDVE